MLNFFKRKNNGNHDSTIDANEILENERHVDSDEDIETELSIHPSWKINDEEVYVYRFMNNENEPLKPNQISLACFEVKKLEDQVAVGAFVRSSLNKPVKFDKSILLLLTEDGTKIARKEFDLSKLDEIPGRSSRPWGFIFDKKDLYVSLEEVPVEGVKLAFELKKTAQQHTLELEDSWQKSMAEDDIEKLKQYTESLNPPKPGEVNFLGLQAKQSEDGNLHVTMLIRNGSEKNINLHQLPLQFEDASGEVIATGGFNLENFEVKANTSKPWTFIFPKAMITKEAIDLSKWKAYPIQKK